MVLAEEVLLFTRSVPANLNTVIMTGNHNTFALRPGIGVQKTDNFNPRRITFAIGIQILELFCASNFGFILMCSYKNKKNQFVRRVF
jgi:predicted permease